MRPMQSLKSTGAWLKLESTNSFQGKFDTDTPAEVVVKNQNQAVEVCKKLVKEEGVHSIILCHLPNVASAPLMR
jgi:hypothetical protein